MEVTHVEPNYVNPKKAKSVVNLRLIDPHTHRTLCNIRAPKLKICQYKHGPGQLINLESFIKDLKADPDFGFDTEQLCEKEAEGEPNMMSLLGDRRKHNSLWTCIDDMKDIKDKYNRMVQQKQMLVPRQLRNRKDVKDLFEAYILPDITAIYFQEEEEEEESQEKLDSSLKESSTHRALSKMSERSGGLPSTQRLRQMTLVKNASTKYHRLP